MAVKGDKAQAQAQAGQTQKVEAVEDSAPAGAETSTDTGNSESVSKPRGVPKGRKRGPIDPSRKWSLTEEDFNRRNAALAAVLKNPTLGTIKTAASVAAVLAEMPEFEGVNVTPQMVKTRIDTIVAERKVAGRDIPPHLVLATARKLPTDLALFD